MVSGRHRSQLYPVSVILNKLDVWCTIVNARNLITASNSRTPIWPLYTQRDKRRPRPKLENEKGNHEPGVVIFNLHPSRSMANPTHQYLFHKIHIERIFLSVYAVNCEQRATRRRHALTWDVNTLRLRVSLHPPPHASLSLPAMAFLPCLIMRAPEERRQVSLAALIPQYFPGLLHYLASHAN